MPVSEDQLLTGCKKGNVLCQKRLYDLYHPQMLGICIRYAQNRDEAQDILQEGFIKVFTRIGTFKGQGSLAGWIRKVIVNTALEHYRKNKKLRHEAEMENEPLMMVTKTNALDELQAADILAFIHRLPAGYRMVFNLFAIEGYSHEEIARQLDISVNTSYSQYHRAKALLQKALLDEKKTNVEKAAS